MSGDPVSGGPVSGGPTSGGPTSPSLDLRPPADDDRSARAASLRSRAAVEAGDRAAWLALFTPDAIVQDPVGVSPLDPSGDGHRGPDARARFWDDVIAPNRIAMDIHDSHAGGDEVANVLTITTTFPDGATAAVDVVALYRVDPAGSITSLRAFWELDRLRFGPAPS
ncbi:MAG TPA: nuclear transport factor 2 family protein [Aquihabitans sp.]|nr:nuclear transport factor 2 family protein [Aquihabitans sp.]